MLVSGLFQGISEESDGTPCPLWSSPVRLKSGPVSCLLCSCGELPNPEVANVHSGSVGISVGCVRAWRLSMEEQLPSLKARDAEGLHIGP
jgi:hypothetical protein